MELIVIASGCRKKLSGLATEPGAGSVRGTGRADNGCLPDTPTKERLMTPRAKFLTTIAALAVAATGATAIGVAAQGHAMMTPPSFSELDANADGQITRADLTAHAAARFADADSDGNGTLSAAELIARAETHASDRAAQMGTRMINQMDSDGDGELSLDEMQARGAGRFGGGEDMAGRMLDRADTDNDGAVSEAEYTAALENIGERRGMGHGEGMGRGEGNGHGEGMGRGEGNGHGEGMGRSEGNGHGMMRHGKRDDA